jgi:hypothetical protein
VQLPVVALNVAVTPTFAGVFHATAIVPFACDVFASAGFGLWQIEQSNGAAAFRCAVGLTCASCAPTRMSVTAVAPVDALPVPPYPGAAFHTFAPEPSTAAPVTPASVPWHAVHPLFGLSTAAFVLPFTCVSFTPAASPLVAYPVPWQSPHAVFCGCTWPAVALSGGVVP